MKITDLHVKTTTEGHIITYITEGSEITALQVKTPQGITILVNIWNGTVWGIAAWYPNGAEIKLTNKVIQRKALSKI